MQILQRCRGKSKIGTGGDGTDFSDPTRNYISFQEKPPSCGRFTPGSTMMKYLSIAAMAIGVAVAQEGTLDVSQEALSHHPSPLPLAGNKNISGEPPLLRAMYLRRWSRTDVRWWRRKPSPSTWQGCSRGAVARASRQIKRMHRRVAPVRLGL